MAPASEFGGGSSDSIAAVAPDHSGAELPDQLGEVRIVSHQYPSVLGCGDRHPQSGCPVPAPTGSGRLRWPPGPSSWLAGCGPNASCSSWDNLPVWWTYSRAAGFACGPYRGTCSGISLPVSILSIRVSHCRERLSASRSLGECVIPGAGANFCGLLRLRCPLRQMPPCWAGEGTARARDWAYLGTIAHINVLELMAAFMSLQHFRRRCEGRSVLVLTDNTTVAAYINRQGGTRSTSLTTTSSRLPPTFRWRTTLIADFLSRGKCLLSEWSLNPEVFDHLRVAWDLLELDLFANTFNHRLPMYCSRIQDPGAWALDDFSLHWGQFRSYAFPPFHLIPQVLRKVR